MQRRLSLGPEGVDIEFAVCHVLEQRVEFLSVAFFHCLLENPLRRGASRYIRLAHGEDGLGNRSYAAIRENHCASHCSGNTPADWITTS